MSSTNTPRLGLVKPTPGTGELVNVATQINAVRDIIDAAIGATPCTSTTRPTAPFLHQIIRETNTGKVYICTAIATPGPVVWAEVVMASGFNGLFDARYAAATAGTVTQQKFTANGTWTKPAGAKSVYVQCQSGGGAGGGGTTNVAGANSVGGGGGGGTYAEGLFDADSLTATVAVTRGAGGTPAAGATGGTGGTSSFGAYVSAVGGSGGPVKATVAAAHSVEGGHGGQSGTGTLFQGSAGEGGWGEGNLCYGGAGGASHLGGGGRGSRTTTQPMSVGGTSGNDYGGGGGGAAVSGTGAAAAGGVGAPGIVIVTTYF